MVGLYGRQEDYVLQVCLYLTNDLRSGRPKVHTSATKDRHETTSEQIHCTLSYILGERMDHEERYINRFNKKNLLYL